MLTQLYVGGRFLLAHRVFAVVGETALHARTADGTAAGTVTDPSGAAIAGSTVALKNGVRVSVTGFQRQASPAPCVPAIKPSAPCSCAEEDYSVAGSWPLQSEAVQNTLGRLLSGTVVTAGRRSLLCFDKICRPVDAHAALP